LVHRSSGTPVATWAWPTWVVSRRRVLEAVSSCWSFHLLREEFLSAPIHSPLSGSPYRSFNHHRRRCHRRWGLRESSPWAPLTKCKDRYHLSRWPPTSSGYDRRSNRYLLVVLPLHASDARRPSNRSRDLLLLDGVARCNSSGRDTPSPTDAGGPLDLNR
jgi:hypothetical protein